MADAYFYPLIFPPTVITEPGQYKTRCGEIVTVESTSAKHDFANRGFYGNTESRIDESWHRSGRINASRQTTNDIVSRA
ncbi:hypothetical protein [Pseudomonas syringae]|uniref:hypothetical protein n=1 Tax=Pseudomonas syringae TaxID=317 RepID=UPI001F35B443|nr:hypothetical protein [Pseudomonas syringae]MCF5374488.1 hypothetical protein [Pseudomonas syringae]MCF5381973.1 hypothetical protein [Pseudomonas syringae]MCF5419495.1 hypothetical protein [Pseudomonas syringae]MCF5454831.1 hypothetical protein [Pseudomonas syringae]MCF5456327.1 hypothetical protein [Pseudomonas syringae]